jgi:hypothetical protein
VKKIVPHSKEPWILAFDEKGISVILYNFQSMCIELDFGLSKLTETTQNIIRDACFYDDPTLKWSVMTHDNAF